MVSQSLRRNKALVAEKLGFEPIHVIFHHYSWWYGGKENLATKSETVRKAIAEAQQNGWKPT